MPVSMPMLMLITMGMVMIVIKAPRRRVNGLAICG